MQGRTLMGYAKEISRQFGGQDSGRKISRLADSISSEGSAIKSSKTKEILLLDIQNMANKNRESEERLQVSLDNLQLQTEQYERKIKAYRDQLKLRQAMNEQMYKSKIEGMINEYQENKDKIDNIKADLLLVLKDLRLKYKMLLALMRNRNSVQINDLKAKLLLNDRMRDIFNALVNGTNRQEFVDLNQLAQKFLRDKIKRKAYNALSDFWYNSICDALRKKLAQKETQVVLINKRSKNQKKKLEISRSHLIGVEPTPDPEIIDVQEETVIIYEDQTVLDSEDSDDPQPQIIIQPPDNNSQFQEKTDPLMKHVHMTINLQKKQPQKGCPKHPHSHQHQHKSPLPNNKPAQNRSPYKSPGGAGTGRATETGEAKRKTDPIKMQQLQKYLVELEKENKRLQMLSMGGRVQ